MSSVSLVIRLDRQIGDFACLVDDAILNILCCCDIVSLLHVEQTCKYLKILVAKKEVWLAVLYNLPHESAPSIAPHHRRQEADFRDLAVRAVQGYRNWTSSDPKPFYRANLGALEFKFPGEGFGDIQFLSGGRYLVYLWEDRLSCLDVQRDVFVFTWRYGRMVRIGFGCEMNLDGKSVRIFISCLKAARGASEAVLHEVIEYDLESGKRISTHSVELDPYHAPQTNSTFWKKPTFTNPLCLIPFKRMSSAGLITMRGAVLLNWFKRLAVLLSWQECDISVADFDSPTCIASNHLLYISGRDSGAPSVHSIHLSQFTQLWQECDNSEAWITHSINRFDAESFTLPVPSGVHRYDIYMDVHPPNWLDLEKAQLADQSVISLSLVDLLFVWPMTPHHIGGFRRDFNAMYFHLHFSEYLSSSYTGAIGKFNLESVSETFTKGLFVVLNTNPKPIFPPSRHGHLIEWNSWIGGHQDRRARAIALLPTTAHCAELKHLRVDEKEGRPSLQVQIGWKFPFVMDYYSSVVLTNVQGIHQQGEQRGGTAAVKYFIEHYA
ncbi:hypothetical protein DFH11DRAFT_1749358 [Phellopilus nigrolimitatus]|nr:hypothetical protein DFH11DRAFT_1749358 [Phellopilus nigrolimitatus]